MSGKESATSTSSKKETAKNHQVTPSAKQEGSAPRASSSITAWQQALDDPGKMSPAEILTLQRLHGNRAVAQLLANRTLQAKITAPIAQRMDEEDELQAKPLPAGAQGNSPETTRDQRPNQTGLPDGLKSGIESLSGISLDDVNVHFNSSQPDQLDALAYTQGSEIHVAPGQEQHLPHEAWHIVQQAQGRVQPTMQLKDGVPVNDDQGLEHEADEMGTKALRMRRSDQVVTGPVNAMQLVSKVAQLQAKPQFANQKLKNYANALFKNRPARGKQIGDGSALSACSREVNGGAKVGGADHQTKCEDILRGLARLLDNHEKGIQGYVLSEDDHQKALDLEDDLHDALEGHYNG